MPGPADEPGQPLRAAVAGDDPQPHPGSRSAGPSPTTWKSHASGEVVVASERVPAISAITARQSLHAAERALRQVDLLGCRPRREVLPGKASSRCSAMRNFSSRSRARTMRIVSSCSSRSSRYGEIVRGDRRRARPPRLVQHAARDGTVALDGEETGLGEIGIKRGVLVASVVGATCPA